MGGVALFTGACRHAWGAVFASLVLVSLVLVGDRRAIRFI
jgi:hypothetical protein